MFSVRNRASADTQLDDQSVDKMELRKMTSLPEAPNTHPYNGHSNGSSYGSGQQQMSEQAVPPPPKHSNRLVDLVLFLKKYKKLKTLAY